MVPPAVPASALTTMSSASGNLFVHVVMYSMRVCRLSQLCVLPYIVVHILCNVDFWRQESELRMWCGQW